MAKRSLLLVDSDAKSSRVLEVSLKKADFDVITAASGPEALEKAQKVRPDLVISDSELGDMDGYDFCREFKTHDEWKSIPFIFLTAQTEIEDKIRGLELGVDDYLTKPIYIKEILTRVRILLQKRDKERLELKKDGDTRFSGKLSDMGVVDLIQTIEVSRKTGVIHCRASEERQAALFFREGQVIDAEAGALQGEDAVYRLLTWSDGDFEVLFRPVRRKAVIELSTQALLMEGMRRLDEWGRVLEQIPTLDSQLEIVYEDLYERLADLPDELNQILRLFDSRRTLLDVIDASKIGDLETVEVKEGESQRLALRLKEVDATTLESWKQKERALSMAAKEQARSDADRDAEKADAASEAHELHFRQGGQNEHRPQLGVDVEGHHVDAEVHPEDGARAQREVGRPERKGSAEAAIPAEGDVFVLEDGVEGVEVVGGQQQRAAFVADADKALQRVVFVHEPLAGDAAANRTAADADTDLAGLVDAPGLGRRRQRHRKGGDHHAGEESFRHRHGPPGLPSGHTASRSRRARRRPGW